MDELQSKMSQAEKDALPCYADGNDIKMVNKYTDGAGNTRVWGAYMARM